METVRTGSRGPAPEWNRRSRALGCPPPRLPPGVPVLDLVYVLATIALFAIVALVTRGVEKL